VDKEEGGVNVFGGGPEDFVIVTTFLSMISELHMIEE